MTARGEGFLTVGGDQEAILFTNRALAQAEVELGKAVLQIATDAAEGNLGMGDVARLLLIGMQAARREARSGRKPPNLGDAYDVMDEVGFAEAARVVMEALADVLSYGPDQGDEEDNDHPPAD